MSKKTHQILFGLIFLGIVVVLIIVATNNPRFTSTSISTSSVSTPKPNSSFAFNPNIFVTYNYSDCNLQPGTTTDLSSLYQIISACNQGKPALFFTQADLAGQNWWGEIGDNSYLKLVPPWEKVGLTGSAEVEFQHCHQHQDTNTLHCDWWFDFTLTDNGNTYLISVSGVSDAEDQEIVQAAIDWLLGPQSPKVAIDQDFIIEVQAEDLTHNPLEHLDR